MKKLLVLIIFMISSINVLAFCVDTDNGIMPYAYGQTNGNYDYCLNDTDIREYYCHNGQLEYKDIECKKGCIERNLTIWNIYTHQSLVNHEVGFCRPTSSSTNSLPSAPILITI